jgi:hypothetical protein
MAMVTGNMDHLIRSELWSGQLKDILLDELEAQKWVNWLSGFPDGSLFTIPSIAEASVQPITENQPFGYESLDTGEFQFTITDYVGSAHYITKKALQDSFYASRVLASFVPKESRAIMEYLESRILAVPSPANAGAVSANVSNGGGQTNNDANSINGAAHRLLASGTSAVVALKDFALAKYALKKANVPLNNLVAIVDPSVGYNLETLTNIVNISNNVQWEGLIKTGMTTGMRFIKNIYGFDVYESNYLAVGSDINNSTAELSFPGTWATNAVQNLMFSAAGGDLNPIMGAWRQMPTVDSEYNKDLQREEYVTTCRFGLKLYRPENMVCVLSDKSQVS